jgi:hypothetical protein
MMEETETLLALAEIAAAFAGFAALVSVLRRRDDRLAEVVHDLLRLRLVISSGVAGVAAALIPVSLAGFGLDTEIAWRAAALAFLLFDNGIIVSFLRAYKPVEGAFDPDRFAVWVASGLELVEQLSLVVVFLGLAGDRAGSLYVTALVANICQAGFIFMRFVASAFHYQNQLLDD